MPSKVTCGGSVLWVTEFELREIDEHGDAIDVNHYETAREAIADAAVKAAQHPERGWVVEKHRSRHPARGYADSYTTLATFGDAAALAAGGWVPSFVVEEEAAA